MEFSSAFIRVHPCPLPILSLSRRLTVHAPDLFRSSFVFNGSG